MRKNVKGKGIGRKHAGMYAALSVPNVGKTDARGVSEVWQTLGLETPLFGCVAMAGLRRWFSASVAAKGFSVRVRSLDSRRSLGTCILNGCSPTGEFSDVWQIKKLGDGGQGAGVRQEKESRDRRGCAAANTGENSTSY